MDVNCIQLKILSAINNGQDSDNKGRALLGQAFAYLGLDVIADHPSFLRGDRGFLWHHKR
jgi:hypothetical protein